MSASGVPPPADMDLAQLVAAIVATTGDAILSTDAAGKITFWNAGAERLLGYAAPEILGEPIQLIAAPEVVDAEAHCRHHALEKNVPTPCESVWLRNNGTRVDVSLTISPISSATGESLGTSTIARAAPERHKLEQSAQHLAAIVESSDDAIVSKDLDSIIKSWNSAAEQLFGFTAAEIVGQSVRILIPNDRQLEEDDVLARIRRGDRVDHYETIRRRKDGSLVPVSLTVSPIRRPDGTVIGASKIARDISDRERAEQERQRLLAMSRDASRLKDEFLATLSHELRTPLNAIVGYVSLMQANLLTGDKLRKAINAISRNATSLTQIVEDVLDVSRIVSGQVRLNLTVVDMASVVRDALETARPAAEAKGVALELDEQPPVSTVMGDPDRLRQVMWNLLSNAVKFTERGGRVVTRIEQVGANIHVVVTDTGAGIPAEFLPHVFDRFRQLDAGMARARGGLGLGLSIVKHLIELQGGRVRAESAGVGTGSSFHIELPVGATQSLPAPADPSAGRAGDGSHHIPVPNLRGIRVLAVDDDADALALIREILETTGASVITADSAPAALKTLETYTPHVLITDLGMPQMSGLDLIDSVRRSEREDVRSVPAVALTAFARSEDRTRALRRGFHLHVSKPVDPRALMEAVATLVHRPLPTS